MDLKKNSHKYKKRIAFIAISYIDKPDGISIYIENLLQELINKVEEKKYHILLDVYTLKTSYPNLKKRIRLFSSTNYIRVNFIPISEKNFFHKLINITIFLYNNKYDIVYLPNPIPIILPFREKITTIHDLSFKIVPEYYSIFTKFYSELLIKLSIKNSKAIGYISKNTKKDLYKFFKIQKKKKLIYLPNGIPSKIKKQETLSIKEVNKKFSNKNLKILFVGRINRHKGFDRVLEFVKFADTILEKDKYFDSIQIHVVGKKTKETKEILKGYVPKNIQLKFWGYLSDEKLNELYKNSQFCLFLSRNEGYGLPLIEALWLRTIPILSDIPIFKEIMGNDYIFFSSKTGYSENIYKFIKMVYENRNYRENLMKKLDSVVEKEKDGYKIAAENLLKYIINN